MTVLKLLLALISYAATRPRDPRCSCCPEHRPTERLDVRGAVPGRQPINRGRGA